MQEFQQTTIILRRYAYSRLAGFRGTKNIPLLLEWGKKAFGNHYGKITQLNRGDPVYRTGMTVT